MVPAGEKMIVEAASLENSVPHVVPAETKMTVLTEILENSLPQVGPAADV